MYLSVEMIDQQLTELTPKLEADPKNIDLTRRLAELWEARFKKKQDQESLDGAFYYYHQLNELFAEPDLAVRRKLYDLHLQSLVVRIKSLEDWFAQGGAKHVSKEEADAYGSELENLKKELVGGVSKTPPPAYSAPLDVPAKLFTSFPSDRNIPPCSGPGIFSAN